MVEFVPDLVQLGQLVSTLVMEVLFHPFTVLLEATVQHSHQLLLDPLELLLHGGVHLILVVLEVAHDVVLLVGDAFSQSTEFLLALSLAVWKAGLPRLSLAGVYWLWGWRQVAVHPLPSQRLILEVEGPLSMLPIC